jgi:hypothetical protein
LGWIFRAEEGDKSGAGFVGGLRARGMGGTWEGVPERKVGSRRSVAVAKNSSSTLRARRGEHEQYLRVKKKVV